MTRFERQMLIGLVLSLLLAGFAYPASGALVAAGDAHSLAVRSDGTVWAWGDNRLGQLGDGTTTERHTPVQVSGLTGVVAVAAGERHSLAVKSDGTVWAWGGNSSGDLGDGTTGDGHTPVQASGLTGVVAAAAGGGLSLAVKSDGTVWAWGDNGGGDLGDGTTTQRNTPVQVSGLTGVVAAAAGASHGLALKSDGTVWAWGYNGSGQLGDGTSTDRHTPIQVWGLTDVVTVGAGYYHSLAVRSDGTVWAWGDNLFGELGDGTTTERHTPVRISGLADVVTVSGGGFHSLAIKSNGTVWAWGNNRFGELGDGTTTTERHTPVQVSGLTAVVTIATGERHSLAIRIDGTGWAWGENAYGQLGDGTTTRRISPVLSTALVGIIIPALSVTPVVGMTSIGAIGGPFTPADTTYMLGNTTTQPLNWTANKTQPWVTLSSTSGTLAPGKTDTVTVSINNTATGLAINTYNDVVTLTNATAGVGTTRPVSLTVGTPAAISVTPATGLTSTGLAGGPFSPGIATYTLTNTGAQSLNWTASKTQSWVSVSKDSGMLAPGDTEVVYVLISSEANSLSINTYTDAVSFNNITNGTGSTTRPIALTVTTPAALAVAAATGSTSSGPMGGPFVPASTTYTLTNTGGQSLDWSAGQTQFWFTLSKTSGTLAGGATDTVTVSINNSANTLIPDCYSGTLTFTNRTNGNGTTSRSVALAVTSATGWLSVTPSATLDGAGVVGGPFSPASKTYTLSNTGQQTLNWTAGTTQSWVAISKASGTLAPGATDTVTVSINSAANNLVAGNFSGAVTFTNSTNGNGNATWSVHLTVAAPKLSVTPAAGLTSTGPAGGPFSPTSTSYALTNIGSTPLDWTAGNTPFWITLSKTSGTLAPGASDTVTVLVNSAAESIGAYSYSGTVSFMNASFANENISRSVALTVEGSAQPGPVVFVDMERYATATWYFRDTYPSYQYYWHSASAYASAFEVFDTSLHDSTATQHSEIQPRRIVAFGSVHGDAFISTIQYGEQGRSHFRLEFDVIRPVQFSIISAIDTGDPLTPSSASFALSGSGIATIEGSASTSGLLGAGRYSLNADVSSGGGTGITGSFTFDFEFSEMRGDINHDNYINVGDLQLLVAAWASSSCDSHWSSDADLNSDGYINVGDLQILIANWGSSP